MGLFWNNPPCFFKKPKTKKSLYKTHKTNKICNMPNFILEIANGKKLYRSSCCILLGRRERNLTITAVQEKMMETVLIQGG